jgi:CIC family chloride channel protein
VVDPIEANALHGGRMSMRDSLRLLVSTVLVERLGRGGRDGGRLQPARRRGAGQGRGSISACAAPDQRIFVGAGAGAAIAAAFNAPLAGAFYGYELIIGGYSVRALAPVAAASLSATLAERALSIRRRCSPSARCPTSRNGSIWCSGVLGAAAAGYSVLAMQSVTWAERLLRRLPLPQWLRPAIGGLLVTVHRAGGAAGTGRRTWRHPGPVRPRSEPLVSWWCCW